VTLQALVGQECLCKSEVGRRKEFRMTLKIGAEKMQSAIEDIPMIEMNVARGDITLIPADVIVNAAKSSLLGGGGVDGAIHRKGGPDILDECKKIRARQGGCAVGDAVVTTAGKLPAQYVIHAVGPTWQGGEKHEPEASAENLSRLPAARQVAQCREYFISQYFDGDLSLPQATCGRHRAGSCSLLSERGGYSQDDQLRLF